MSSPCAPMRARRTFYAKRSRDSAGRFFGSKTERTRWEQLRLMEQAGVIRDLRHQVPVELAGCVAFKADFAYVELPSGRLVHEDAKGGGGIPDRRFAVICQLWPYWADTPLIVTGDRGRFVREILPQPQQRVAWMREELARLTNHGSPMEPAK